MQEHYDCLGITPDASPAQLKAAYHAKLKEFPAHSHPQEFKAVRAAYEALRKGAQQSAAADFFKLQPIQAKLDPDHLEQLRQRTEAQASIDIVKLIRLTF